MFRSPIAKAFFNYFAKGNVAAESCGTWVRKEHNSGKTLFAIGSFNTLEYMSKQGFDLFHEKARQITPDMVRRAEKVIVMAERDTWPEYLRKSQKVVVWHIKNPDTFSATEASRIGNQIKSKVLELARRI